MVGYWFDKFLKAVIRDSIHLHIKAQNIKLKIQNKKNHYMKNNLRSLALTLFSSVLPVTYSIFTDH